MNSLKTIDRKLIDDSELVQRLQQGEAQAMEEIYNRYWKRLLAVAFGIMRDKDDAQEIVQRVFINLWDKKESLQINNLSAYLATAVRYTVYSHIQSNNRKKEVGRIYIEKRQTKDDSEEKIYALFLKNNIDNIVDKLPDRCKLVFVYSRKYGKTIPEIATELNIAEKTVESHLTKALKRVRISLKEMGIISAFILWLIN